MEDIAELFKSGENILEELQGDGDFRSEESIELLKEADIVVTNPPFSLFREYIAQLMEYEKQFLIIGNANAVICKEIFPLFKDNKMWVGYRPRNLKFVLPNGDLKSVNTWWYTNLDISKRREELILVHKYNSEKYPKYDNYDAINVDKVVEIPLDYEGVMGVPITFMDKFNPEQFEILGMAAGNTRANKFNYNVPHKRHENDRGGNGVVAGERKYARFLIRNRHPEKQEVGRC